MNEDFLSWLWHYRLFPVSQPLSNGSRMMVEQPGKLNRDSGPDFLGARIRIDQTLWIGNVEIHVKSSDWFLHGHQNDPAFDTVILHVVFEHDKEVTLGDKSIVPVFEVKKLIAPELYTRYLQFMASAHEIPCHNIFDLKRMLFPNQWLTSLGMQRLIRKGETLNHLRKRPGIDWQELFYVAFCKSFGNKINDDIFEMLALKTPLMLVRKYSRSLAETEALFFGQAGLIPEDEAINDPYISSLQDQYQHIVYAHHPEALPSHHWKFMRTRPANFPTIRIAQLSALISSFIDMNPLSVDDIRQWVSEATGKEVSEYWQNHYHFGQKGRRLPRSIGKGSAERLVINGMVPPLLVYGDVYKNHHYINDLLEFVSGLPPEENRITRLWKPKRLCPTSAIESQGITELNNEYCRQKRCLECRFGHQLLTGVLKNSG